MKTRAVFLTLSLMMLSTSVLAGGKTPPKPDPASTEANSAAVGVGVGVGVAGAAAEQSQAQQQLQQQLQQQQASADARSEQANAQSLELNQEYRQVRQTPPALAGGTNTTAACRYSVGLGGSAPVAGLSFGLGRKDKDCERLVLAQYLREIGQTAAAERVLCRITELRKALGEDCLALVHQVPVAQAPRFVTPEELERAFKKAVEK